MNFKLHRQDDFSVSTWSGGTTTQLAIYPEDAKYADRDFIWRLSSATCDLSESDFTDLPDYNRVLAVLHGEVVLAHEGDRSVKLGPLEYDYFDGAQKTKSYGQCTDYNLMTRKGYTGRLETIELTEKEQLLEVAPALWRGLFCTGGYAVVKFDGNSMMIGDGEQLVIEDCPKSEIAISGEGYIIHTEVSGKGAELKKNAGNEELSEEGAAESETEIEGAYPFEGKSNFALAQFLSFADFRWTSILSKKHKQYWYDEALVKGLSVIQKIYLPFGVLLAGLLGILYVVLLWYPEKTTLAGVLCLVWFFVWLFVASPLVFMAAAPKPIWKHIKYIDKLTPKEIEIELKRNGSNPRLEKLLKKYKNVGIYDYDEEE